MTLRGSFIPKTYSPSSPLKSIFTKTFDYHISLHEDGHYHAGKSFDAVALTELRQDEGSHLCILPLLGSRE